jgi:hypothetical protein
LHADPNRNASLIALIFYSTLLDSPLLSSGIGFLDIFSTFSLSIEIAEILDDMKFLTSSIRTFETSRDAPTASDPAKVIPARSGCRIVSYLYLTSSKVRIKAWSSYMRPSALQL